MKYGWIIDKDYIAEPEAKQGTNDNAVGVMGPRNIDEATVKNLKAGAGRKFRMYDDDDTLYYEGRILTQSDGEELFAPLDDFGTPNAGATSIRYLNGTKWEVL